MSFPVKFFASTQQGAPQLGNNWGDLTNMLDAVLVDGFNSRAATGITSVTGIATINFGAGHAFLPDQVLVVSGADQVEYNVEARVLSITTNALTYAITGTPASPATTAATITAKMAPLGFERVFTATNKRVYRSRNLSSNRPYLRVDNSCDPLYNTTYAKKAKMTMAENMSDIDTFVGARAPYNPVNPVGFNEVATGSGVSVIDGWYKWIYAYYGGYSTNSATSREEIGPAAGNRNWQVVGDDRGFYFFTEWWPGSGHKTAYCFTDFSSTKTGDLYNTIMCCTENYTQANSQSMGYYGYSGANGAMPISFDFTGKVCMRDHTGFGNTQRLGFTSFGATNAQLTSGYGTGIPYPNPSDYSLIIHPTYIVQESNKGMRGKMPGLMWVVSDQPLSDLSVVANVKGYEGKKFVLISCGNGGNANARVAMDITGPWW